MNHKPGIHGPMANLYDVFVDWPSRLSREMPPIIAALKSASVKKVLDVGCGTGRHVKALLDAGFDAYGADISPAMLDEAKQLTGQSERFIHWAMGTPANTLPGAFDAIICMGNVWPQVTGEANVQAAAKSLHDLLKPGGLLLMGMKAVAVRKAAGNPYMPMLKRMHEDRPIYFIRMIDFTPGSSGSNGEELCEFHMIVVRGDSQSNATADLHNVHLSRVWSPDSLRQTFTQAGFADVKISGKLGDFTVAPTTEDVFVRAVRPAD